MAAEALEAATDDAGAAAPLKTPLHARHVALGARMVPFAGYDMPVQYPTGILTEHNWTREKAGLFDVSHMGQAFLVGPDHETTAKALEALIPADILNLAPGKRTEIIALIDVRYPPSERAVVSSYNVFVERSS